MKTFQYIIYFLLLGALVAAGAYFLRSRPEANSPGHPAPSITISEEHPSFWQYKGKTLLLLGGTDEDNLFQMENVEEHLDLLASVGGNYVRNTLSSRDSGNLWPFKKLESGNYDLDYWNDEYWKRLEFFLDECDKRDIIVQVEMWATFDFYRDNWAVNPYNPKNNVNYSPGRSKLPLEVPTHPIFTENDFFRSVPSQMALAPVLWYQKLYVDKVLSYSLKHGNVLYCMDNETSVTADWGKFWASYIQKVASRNGKKVHTTEMWDPWNLSHPFHAETFDNPAIFTFVDISQNNHIVGQEHWENGISQIERLIEISALRPVNNVKVYGNNGGKHKTTRDAIENYTMNVLMGCASTRFHRPNSGQGLNQTAQAVIKSLREVTNRVDHFNAKPANDLLLEREEHEAYCRAIPGESYLVYFPDGGEISIDFSGYNKEFSYQWIDLLQAGWSELMVFQANGVKKFTTPEKGHKILIISYK